MLFCLVIFTVIESGARKMDLQDLADQERLCWDSWRKWMPEHTVIFILRE